MAFWQNYLTKKIIFENHPALENGRCLNTLQTKNKCTVCQDICPHKVFQTAEPKWTLCDNCGLCVAACPARCLTLSSMAISKFLEFYQNMGSTLSISCRNNSAEADYKLPCLASLPWEFLALLALKGKVALNTSLCTNCEKSCNHTLFHDSLKKVRLFLGEEDYNKQIHLVTEDMKSTSRQYSRREAFSFFSAKSKTAVVNLIPDLDSLSPNGLFGRQLLNSLITQLAEKNSYQIQLPKFNENCTACGLCTKLCPGQALHRLQYEEYENQWFMALIPWRCSDCGLCQLICPNNALQTSSPIRLANIQKPLVYQITSPSCFRCGEPLINTSSNLCDKCQAETPSPLIW